MAKLCVLWEQGEKVSPCKGSCPDLLWSRSPSAPAWSTLRGRAPLGLAGGSGGPAGQAVADPRHHVGGGDPGDVEVAGVPPGAQLHRVAQAAQPLDQRAGGPRGDPVVVGAL